MHEPISSTAVAKYIFYILSAIFGGIVHALVVQRNGGIKNKYDLLAVSIISGFAGTMWMLLALQFYPGSHFVIAFASGFGGYLSVEGLAMIATRLREFISKQ